MNPAPEDQLEEAQRRFQWWGRALWASILVMITGGVVVAASGRYINSWMVWIGFGIIAIGFLLGQVAISGLAAAGKYETYLGRLRRRLGNHGDD